MTWGLERVATKYAHLFRFLCTVAALLPMVYPPKTGWRSIIRPFKSTPRKIASIHEKVNHLVPIFSLKFYFFLQVIFLPPKNPPKFYPLLYVIFPQLVRSSPSSLIPPQFHPIESFRNSPIFHFQPKTSISSPSGATPFTVRFMYSPYLPTSHA